MDLGDMALQIVILGIIVSIGATNEADTIAYNVTDDAVTGLSEYGNWFSIIIIVSIAAVILALIFSAFGGRGRGATY